MLPLATCFKLLQWQPTSLRALNCHNKTGGWQHYGTQPHQQALTTNTTQMPLQMTYDTAGEGERKGWLSFTGCALDKNAPCSTDPLAVSQSNLEGAIRPHF